MDEREGMMMGRGTAQVGQVVWKEQRGMADRQGHEAAITTTVATEEQDHRAAQHPLDVP